MPAPALLPQRGSISYALVQSDLSSIEKNGFRITATLTSPSEGSDWTLSVQTQLVDPAVAPDDIESARFVASSITIPFAAAGDLATALAKAQLLVDLVHDEFIPGV